MARKSPSEQERRASSERLKRLWSIPQYRERIAKLSAERMTRLNADAAFAAKRNAANARQRRTPEARRQASEHFQRVYQDPQQRAALSARASRTMSERREEFAGYALKGSREQHGIFYCPAAWRGIYKGLCQKLGLAAARDEIRRRLERETFGKLAPDAFRK